MLCRWAKAVKLPPRDLPYERDRAVPVSSTMGNGCDSLAGTLEPTLRGYPIGRLVVNGSPEV